MKAIELRGLEGFKSLRVADVENPKPAAKVGRALLERGESSMRRAVIPEISGNRQIAQKEEKLMATTILGTAFHPLIAELGNPVEGERDSGLKLNTIPL